MPIDPKDFSLLPLKNAFKYLDEALAQVTDELTRDGCIQRIEYTFELSWKTLKKYFEMNNNLSEDNVKNLFREAGKQGLIDSVELWFEFQIARNKTSHIYSQNVAVAVFEQVKLFAPECRKLIEKLEKLIA